MRQTLGPLADVGDKQVERGKVAPVGSVLLTAISCATTSRQSRALSLRQAREHWGDPKSRRSLRPPYELQG